MTKRKKPRTGAGKAEGKPSRPTEPTAPDSETQADEQIEIPIGTPVSAEEFRRLKRAAEQHSDRDDEEGRTQSDTP
jgi:hypothetical protein